LYAERPWYADGLRFSCTQCGKCCRGSPGQVWISDSEIESLAAHLDLDEKEFRRDYTFIDGARGVSLKDKGRQQDYQCVFYESQQGCTVYSRRPKQCRTWPFWRPVVRSRRSWYEHALDCPGMNYGPIHGAELIASTADNDGIA
jgi:Fe-S-cluster containining protein